MTAFLKSTKIEYKKSVVSWVERYFYAPSVADRLLSYCLYPLSLLYCFTVWLRYKAAKETDCRIPIISVGNLTVGGSGKTPLVSALASTFTAPCIILRGYGRHSSGLLVVKDSQGIRCDVKQSGDEAMIYAQKLSKAVVIVSENRMDAIAKAQQMHCEVVFLDDGYSKHNIKKYDILIDIVTPNTFCLPAGPFRERLWRGKTAYIAREERTFKRNVTYKNLTSAMLLVTAIARPERLQPYLPKGIVGHRYFPDHYYFQKEELEQMLHESGAASLLVTYKDYVKLADFNLPLSLMDLDVEVSQELQKNIQAYVNNLKAYNPSHTRS